MRTVEQSLSSYQQPIWNHRRGLRHSFAGWFPAEYAETAKRGGVVGKDAVVGNESNANDASKPETAVDERDISTVLIDTQ